MAYPKIDANKCTGCFTCTDVCPMGVFAKNEKAKKAVVKKPKDCIACRACEVNCEQKAIKVIE